MHQAIYPHHHAIPNLKSNKFIGLPKPALIPFHSPTPCGNSTPSIVHWESCSYLILRRHLHNWSFPWVKHHIHLSNNAKLKELKFLKQTRAASGLQTSELGPRLVWSTLKNQEKIGRAQNQSNRFLVLSSLIILAPFLITKYFYSLTKENLVYYFFDK